MASSPSTLLKLELQASGEHPDTWGDNLNATLVLVENAIAKRASIVTTGGTTTLTDTQYADNQARCAMLDFSGALVSNAIIVVPTRTKSWIVRNQCTGAFTLTVKTSAGTGVVVSQGSTVILWCDGVNVLSVSTDATSLGGFASSAFARLAALAIFTAGFGRPIVGLVDGATITADVSAASAGAVTLGGNRTLALANPADGSEYILYAVQDATGGRTLALPANVLGAANLTLSTAANAIDKLTFHYRASNTSWYATIVRGLVTGGSSPTTNITVTGNGDNVDVFALAGQPAGAATVNFTVASGVIIGSKTPGTPALDFSGFAASSVINLTISANAYVIGAGGRGGNGGFVGDVTSADVFGGATDGTPGGEAIRFPSAATTITVTNNGHIWGGGGGGGGGGPSGDGSGSNVGSTGGGGGGGAGGGVPGTGGQVAFTAGGNGGAGGCGRTGTGGAAGTGTSTGGGGGAASGGAGGNYGAAGANGAATTSGSIDVPAGAGGAAGKAINYNGGSAPTYAVAGDILGATS